MRLHVASGYDPDIYDFTWHDFTTCDPHTWVVTAFEMTAPDTFTPRTGCLVGWNGRKVTLSKYDGTTIEFVPESVYVLGDACHHAAVTR